MLAYNENVLCYFVGVGLFFGFAFPLEVPVKCKSNSYLQLPEAPKGQMNCPNKCETCKSAKKSNQCLKKNVIYEINCSHCGNLYIGETGRQCKMIYNYYCNESGWDEAKTYCSKSGGTLLNFTDSRDLQYVRSLNVSVRRIWIGLKKNKTGYKAIFGNMDDFFKIRRFEFATASGTVSYRNTYKILPSVCVKSLQDQCDVHWQKNDSQCFLPVYDRMSCLGALAHCKRLNGTLNAGNFARALIFNASRNIGISSFWTGKLKENNIDPHAKWTWNNGSLFKEWDERKIIITDVGCSGCGFFKNGTIYLTSNCLQPISYLCEKDRKQKINSSSLNQRQLSWELAKRKCSLLQLSRHENDVTDALPQTGDRIIQEDMSYWLGIHKNNTCKTHMVEDLANVMESTLTNCLYVENSYDNGGPMENDCDEKNHAICVKPDVCPNNWSRTRNGLCWRAFDKVRMTWKAAYSFCLQHDSRLANLTDVQVINKTATDGIRYWINSAKIKVYPPQDPLQGWYWLDGRVRYDASHRRGLYGRLKRYTGSNERCAMIHESESVSWRDMPCSTKPQSFVCKKRERVKSTNGSDMDSKEVEAKIRLIRFRRKGNGSNLKNGSDMDSKEVEAKIRLIRFRRKGNGSNLKIEEILSGANKELLQLAKKKSLRRSFKNKTEDGTVVEVLTTSLDRLSDMKGSMPIKSLRKLCREQPNCTVKIVTVHLKDVDVDISHLSDLSPLVSSDIITLDYIANEELISKLEGNETISLNFSKKLKSITKNQVNCLFLDGNKWNRTGVTVGSIDGENIECLTDHLSSFTMVVLDAEVSQSNKVALNYINYVGSTLSLAGLLLTCIIYIVLYKDLQILTTSRHLVHFNLQIALGLTQIVFLAGGNATQNETACKVVAILVHYFSLAGFTWILLEAVMLYLKLISVYGGEFVRMKNFLLFGWGFPLLLVGLSAGVKIDAYGTDQWCWLSYEDGFVWVFFAPVIIITSVTLVVVIAVIRVLFIASKSEEAGAKKNIISAARCVIILFPTLGLSWGFSVIAVNHDALIWKYLFAIFTSLQGFFIFLIYGVCNAEIRCAVSRKMGYDVHPSTSMT